VPSRRWRAGVPAVDRSGRPVLSRTCSDDVLSWFAGSPPRRTGDSASVPGRLLRSTLRTPGDPRVRHELPGRRSFFR